jgi:hypothetical protein
MSRGKLPAKPLRLLGSPITQADIRFRTVEQVGGGGLRVPREKQSRAVQDLTPCPLDLKMVDFRALFRVRPVSHRPELSHGKLSPGPDQHRQQPATTRRVLPGTVTEGSFSDA